MTETALLEISNAQPRLEALTFSKPINWAIHPNQQWAVIGANGSGKSVLIDILTGKHALKTGHITTAQNQSLHRLIKCVAFKDIYSLSDLRNSYYQQRFNAGDEQDMPLVKDLFSTGESHWVETLVNTFAINDLLDKAINLLSSGELRKILIIRSLLAKPRILILDNPFIGLDAKSRTLLNKVLDDLTKLQNIQIVLLVAQLKDIPQFVTHVLPIKTKTILPVSSRQAFEIDTEMLENLFSASQRNELESLVNESSQPPFFDNALSFRNIHIAYGTRTILKGLNWEVKRGEKWALLGENGAGKSTLLSLVSGDNPQAYANDITLFDRKRGTGESIWDIKKHIGYISPEMHLYYLKNVKCIDIVASGFFDTIGLYCKCNKKQEQIALRWMQLFGIENIKETSFLNTSTGEQRLVLLARVFVKNPTLLILDEPLHGLDTANKQHVKQIIETYCTPDRALIYVTHYQDEIPNIISKQLVLTKLM